MWLTEANKSVVSAKLLKIETKNKIPNKRSKTEHGHGFALLWIRIDSQNAVERTGK